RRRDDLLGQQVARSVQVPQDRLEQLGALGQALLQRRPLAAGEHERERVQAPGAGLLAGRGVDGALVGEQALDLGSDAREPLGRQVARLGEQPTPRRTQGALGVDDLVVGRILRGAVLHDRRRVLAQDRHGHTSRYITRYATGATAMSESRRSIRPPWPGSRLPMSLMPTSRLMSDSHRSPRVAKVTPATPSARPAHHGPSSATMTTATPAATLAIIEPAKPSQDFFGEMLGAIGCLPNRTPAA